MIFDVRELIVNPLFKVNHNFLNFVSAKKLVGESWFLGTYDEKTHTITNGILEFLYLNKIFDSLTIRWYKINDSNISYFENFLLLKMNRDSFCNYLDECNIGYKITELNGDDWTYIVTETNVVVTFTTNNQSICNFTKKYI